jgi:hypothetical protein
MEENIVMKVREQTGSKVIACIMDGKLDEATRFIKELETSENFLFSLTQAPKSNPVMSNPVESNINLSLSEMKSVLKDVSNDFDDNDMKVNSAIVDTDSGYVNDKWYHRFIDIENWIVKKLNVETDGLSGSTLADIYYHEFQDMLSPYEKKTSKQGMPFRGRMLDAANKLKKSGFLEGKSNFFQRTDKMYYHKTR